MHLRWSDGDRAFRASARAWLEANVPEERPWSADPGLGMVDLLEWCDQAAFDFARAWQSKLAEGGFLALNWPVEWGGRGGSLAEQVIFEEERIRAEAPLPANQLGLALLGPTLIVHGAEELRNRFLPRILSGEEIWCQGFSEPNAGSDLAAVATRAEQRGDVFVINGQKIWTTLGCWADWIFLLARTDPVAPRHKGLSFLLVDMRQPGVEVRPLRQMTGVSGFSEVFFTDAVTPVANLVGELNDGWRVAMTTLIFERGTSFPSVQVRLRRLADELVTVAQRGASPGRCDGGPAVPHLVGDALVEVEVLRSVALQSLSAAMGSEPPGFDSSVEKLLWSSCYQHITDVAVDLLGPELVKGSTAGGDSRADRWRLEHYAARASTIYSGTSEIQRNIVAQRILGLPRDGMS